MKLHYWNKIPEVKNFGDQLSPWLWIKELPDFFNDDEKELFIGIGTLLDDTVPTADKYIVMGAGAGYHKKISLDKRWKFYAVRGPLTAREYGLEKEKAITDPAILIAKWFEKSKIKNHKTAFIPHWSTAACNWKKVCQINDFEYIDPRGKIEEVLNKISMAEMVISESLHGVIIADVFRVPWIAVQSNYSDFSIFKWNDWMMSMNLNFNIKKVNRPWSEKKSMDNNFKKAVKIIWGKMNVLQNARKLAIIQKNERPNLSDERLISEKVEKYEKRIQEMKNEIIN